MKCFTRLIISFTTLMVFLGCTKTNQGVVDGDIVESQFEGLADNQAVAVIEIDGKPFYADMMQPFKIRLDMSFASFRGNLINSEGANLIFDFTRSEWNSKRPVKFEIASSSSGFVKDYGRFLIGKHLPENDGKLEGYMFVDGTFTVSQFIEDKFVAEIMGSVIHPGDADIPENMKTISGYIIAKKPPMTFDTIRKESIFYE